MLPSARIGRCGYDKVRVILEMLACEVKRCCSALSAFLVLELVHLVVDGVQDSTALFA